MPQARHRYGGFARDSPREGVSRFAGQAGTQAPDPTPVLRQDRGSRAGSTIHILPAEYDQACTGGPERLNLEGLRGADCGGRGCRRHGC